MVFKNARGSAGQLLNLFVVGLVCDLWIASVHAQNLGSSQATQRTHASTVVVAKPNILLIVADDLGFNQLGCYGSQHIRTPNLDRMAASGIRFTQAYAGNTVCSPSRVSLMTGRDSRLMDNNSNTVQLRDIDVTIPQVLKHAGYHTGLFGKYSIGSQMGVTDPLSMGFDTWFGMYSILEGHRQYPPFLWQDNQKIRLRENEGGQRGTYAQRAFTDKTIDFIRESGDEPFFAMLCFSSPHAELAAPAEYAEQYESRFPEEVYAGMSTGTASDQYAWYYPEAVDQPHAVLAGMVTALDAYVGEIVGELEAQGVADNTLILFTSDNGPHDEGGGDPEFFEAAKPYRGMKRDLYDGGIHVPMIVAWPAHINQPRVDETPWVFADVLSTLAEVAGVNLNSVPRVKTNGVSIAPLLRDSPATMPERLLYWEFGKQAGDPNSGIIGTVFQAARRGPWKAVKYGDGAAVELYRINSDPGESQNVASQYPHEHQQMVDLFDEYGN